MSRYLAEHPPGTVDAIYCANTPLLQGTLCAIREDGRRVGTDLGVIAFDDFEWAALLQPSITVIDQHTPDIGRDASAKLLDELAGGLDGGTPTGPLAGRGVPTLLTAVYAPGQAIVAAAAGATYIAPYLGKLQDAGRDGMADVVTMHEIMAATGSPTKVLLASIRDVPAIVALAQRGVGHFTMGPSIAEQFFTDELTADAVRTFEAAVLAAESSR